MLSNNRRGFIKKITLALCTILFLGYSNNVLPIGDSSLDDELSIQIFSNHLQFLNYKSTGEMAAEMGFNGVDLTVGFTRHVLPEHVEVDLPKASAKIKSGRSHCKMITSSIENVKNSLDMDIIKTAAEQGVKYYRTNWFEFIKDKPMQESIEIYKHQIKT